eukprot:3935670-Rhodomonas_salina.1
MVQVRQHTSGVAATQCCTSGRPVAVSAAALIRQGQSGRVVDTSSERELLMRFLGPPRERALRIGCAGELRVRAEGQRGSRAR